MTQALCGAAEWVHLGPVTTQFAFETLVPDPRALELCVFAGMSGGHYKFRASRMPQLSRWLLGRNPGDTFWGDDEHWRLEWSGDGSILLYSHVIGQMRLTLTLTAEQLHHALAGWRRRKAA